MDCVGHTHIDVAWLWTLAQTREKAIPQLCHRQLSDGPLPRVQVPVQPAAAL
ncbi:MAG: hypothetical protein ACLRYE_03055 [Gemmiger formicilis]|uniref:glycoside hydrolase family 38 N-terminal domain-containing protein n=1 Tax=Gemmiger formicilis TaxID=745368 RepID=UPI0039A2636D